jgi:hypothetical protein
MLSVESSRFAVCIRPLVHARGEIRTLNEQFLRLPPLTGLGYARPLCARRESNPHKRLFLREPPLPFGPRARVVKIDTGGEIRTHISRLLRTVCLPVAPLPRECRGRESNPQRALSAHGDLSAARLPFTPPRLEDRTPGEGLEPSSPVPKTGVLPLDDPGLRANPARLERAPSGSASLRSDPSELRVRREVMN